MFGYIIVNKPEMKFREFDVYHGYYCGLCRKLKEHYGKFGQITLSYDMVFVLMTLTSLYELETTKSMKRCVTHPLQKHEERVNNITDYVAHMNILLTYEKWNKINDILEKLSEEEKKDNQDIDQMSGMFGKVMAEIMLYQDDEWKELLNQFGFFLGKFIYLMDAYEDIEDDLKNHNYNPLKNIYTKPEFEDMIHQILTMMIAECSKAFEQLPLIDDIDILRNVLYSGVWYRYEQVREKREKEKEEKNV